MNIVTVTRREPAGFPIITFPRLVSGIEAT
jgi:hypothetical protein